MYQLQFQSSNMPVILFLILSPLLETRKGRIRESQWPEARARSGSGKSGHRPGGVRKVVLKSLPCESGLAQECGLTCFSSP